LRQVIGFLPVSSTNKTDRHDITEILLNTINQNHPLYDIAFQLLADSRWYSGKTYTLNIVCKYKWNIVECGTKHHNPTETMKKCTYTKTKFLIHYINVFVASIYDVYYI
jgi:hypothetical protein